MLIGPKSKKNLGLRVNTGQHSCFYSLWRTTGVTDELRLRRSPCSNAAAWLDLVGSVVSAPGSPHAAPSGVDVVFRFCTMPDRRPSR
jgi:hypothetical protein